MFNFNLAHHYNPLYNRPIFSLIVNDDLIYGHAEASVFRVNHFQLQHGLSLVDLYTSPRANCSSYQWTHPTHTTRKQRLSPHHHICQHANPKSPLYLLVTSREPPQLPRELAESVMIISNIPVNQSSFWYRH